MTFVAANSPQTQHAVPKEISASGKLPRANVAREGVTNVTSRTGATPKLRPSGIAPSGLLASGTWEATNAVQHRQYAAVCVRV